MRAPNALERSHRKLYLSIKSDLSLLEGNKGREIAAYERSFQASRPRRCKTVKKKDLLQAMRKADIILVGDFHPFRQSQKGFLRLLQESAVLHRRPIVAMECFQQAHQCALDEYLGNLITLEELREKIDFERFWPFSWKNYGEILAEAKSRRLRVVALNVLGKKSNAKMLLNRDRAAAQRIAQERITSPDNAVFVLFGELHLAHKHLPSELHKSMGQEGRILIIHQNDPELYWRAPKLRNGQKPEVLQLGKNEFCILSSVPWVKLRSYLDWLEGGSTSEEWDEESDIPGTVHHYAQLLAEAVGLPTRLREDVDIFAGSHLHLEALPSSLEKIDPEDKRLLRHSLRFHRTNYLPHSRALLLPVISTNALSESAAFLFWHSHRRVESKWQYLGSTDLIARFLLGYLGSKILNPKRKCNEVPDLKKMLAQSRRPGKRPSSGEKILRRALSLLQSSLRKGQASTGTALSTLQEIEACRLTGYILGDRLFLAMLKQPALLELVQAWFQTSSSQEASVNLAETAKKLHQAAIRPLGKHEKF